MDIRHQLDPLERLNAIGVALSREENIQHLLEQILLSAMQLTHADAGTVYRVNAARALEFAILVNRSLGLRLGGRQGGECGGHSRGSTSFRAWLLHVEPKNLS